MKAGKYRIYCPTLELSRELPPIDIEISGDTSGVEIALPPPGEEPPVEEAPAEEVPIDEVPRDDTTRPDGRPPVKVPEGVRERLDKGR